VRVLGQDRQHHRAEDGREDDRFKQAGDHHRHDDGDEPCQEQRGPDRSEAEDAR